MVKFDGSKGCKNFIIDDGHCAVVYEYGEKEIFESYGGVDNHKEKDIELFKQRTFLCYKNYRFQIIKTNKIDIRSQ